MTTKRQPCKCSALSGAPTAKIPLPNYFWICPTPKASRCFSLITTEVLMEERRRQTAVYRADLPLKKQPFVPITLAAVLAERLLRRRSIKTFKCLRFAFWRIYETGIGTGRGLIGKRAEARKRLSVCCRWPWVIHQKVLPAGGTHPSNFSFDSENAIYFYLCVSTFRSFPRHYIHSPCRTQHLHSPETKQGDNEAVNKNNLTAAGLGDLRDLSSLNDSTGGRALHSCPRSLRQLEQQRTARIRPLLSSSLLGWHLSIHPSHLQKLL